MSKILKLVEEHFKDDSFTAFDFSMKTGMNLKVCAMNLARLKNSHKIGGFINGIEQSYFFYRSKEEINKARKKENTIIDKYKLSQKKWEML